MNENRMEQVKTLAKYLNCPCRYFPPAEDDSELRKAYDEATALGKQHGFVPVLIAVDFTLIETLMMNITGQAEKPGREEIDDYRRRMLSLSLEDGKTILKQRLDEWTEESELCMGEFSGQSQSDRQTDFSGYWDCIDRKTLPIVLAEIPVKNPWEVFAYLPFGGWNECPDTPELMSVAKYWFERYGAVPAVMTHDVLEFVLPKPITQQEAPEAALEQYGFCMDIVDQGTETIGALADTLCQDSVWYFWWD